MLRYLRLYLYFLRFSFSRAMEFRLDFFFRIGMDVIWYGVHLGFFSVLYQHTASLGSLTYDQVLVFVAAVFVTDGLHMTLFSNNLWWLPIYVNRGDLDYHLVRPVSSLFMLSLRDFAANSFVNLLMGIGVLVWAVARYPGELGLAHGAIFLGMLAAGVFLSYVFNMLFIIPVFWLQSPTGLREIWWSMASFANRPHEVYTGFVRRLFVTVLPLAFIVSFPVQALFEGTGGGRLLLHLAAVLLGSTVLLLWAWRQALRAYASASS